MRRLRKNTGIALLYLLVLALTVPVIYLLPGNGGWAKGIYYEQSINGKDLPFSSDDDPMVGMEFGAQGNRDSYYRISEQNFKVAGNHLDFRVTVSFNNGDAGYTQILIKRKTVDDGEIGVAIYAGKHYLDHLNYTERVIPPNVQMQGSVLNITGEKQAPSQLIFRRMAEDFTQSQFQQEEYGMSGSAFSGGSVSGIIYVEVPKSLEVGKDLNNYAQVSENP